MINYFKMDTKREDIIAAFNKSTRNRYMKLFECYKDLFLNKDYVSTDIAHRINTDLGITITATSIKYIRSRIMKKRVIVSSKKMMNTVISNEINSVSSLDKIVKNSPETFEFNEPKSIDHNQEIVTFRKSKI